jgi:hypothetical protein
MCSDDSGYLYVVDGGNSVVWKISPPFTGINNNIEANSIMAYPNPTTGVFFIKTQNYNGSKFAIFNLLGQQVSNGFLTSEQTTCNIGNCSPGIYFLRISSLGSETTLKIELR